MVVFVRYFSSRADVRDQSITGDTDGSFLLPFEFPQCGAQLHSKFSLM
jgi:hypothetical protein